MPLRKTKARRKPRAVSGPAKELSKDTILEKNLEIDQKCDAVEGPNLAKTQEETQPKTDDDGMDEEERKARETIAILAKKYQVRLTEESTDTLDIIRVDDSEAAQYEENETEELGKENREQASSPLSSRRPRLVPQKQTRQKKLQKAPPEKGSTPVFKVPKPLVNHSTPAPSGDRSLFGFEELDSPLTLSPVATTPAHSSVSMIAHHSTEEGSKLVKPSPYSRLKGTYDIPFKKKTPKRLPRKKREKRKSASGEDQWAEKLNAQFTEVEQFELAVE